MVGQYRIESKLGAGGMGQVFRALHTRLKTRVALKLLSPELLNDPESVARFEREMQAIGRLDHPHIVRAMDAGESDGVRYIVMELVDGINLSTLVKRQGPRSLFEACSIVRQASKGLAYAHENGLIHRDVKPGNLLLTKKGKVKILDLGLARLLELGAGGADSDQRVLTLTRAGVSMGTPDYMAPEQWEDSHTVDGRADLYALGCTLFFLLTGKAPYDTDEHGSVTKKILAHVRAPVPSLQGRLPGVPDELEALHQSLLAKNPAQRPATAGEVSSRLKTIIRRLRRPGDSQVIGPQIDNSGLAPISSPSASGSAASITVTMQGETEPYIDSPSDRQGRDSADDSDASAVTVLPAPTMRRRVPSKRRGRNLFGSLGSRLLNYQSARQAGVCIGAALLAYLAIGFLNRSLKESIFFADWPPSVPVRSPVKSELRNHEAAEPADTGAPVSSAPPAEPARALSTEELIAEAKPGVVLLTMFDASGSSVSFGSGFLIDARARLAATNFHVIETGAKCRAKFYDGTEVDVLGCRAWDERRDLAILELASVPKTAQGLSLAGARPPAQGARVVAIGHPRGLGFTTSTGEVNGLKRTDELTSEVRRSLASPADQLWIQTDATIAGGSSGGPLFDMQGKVVGIMTWILTDVDFAFAAHVQDLADLQRQLPSDPVPLDQIGGRRKTQPAETAMLGELDPRVAALWSKFSEEYELQARQVAKTSKSRGHSARSPIRIYAEGLFEHAQQQPRTHAAYQALVLSVFAMSRATDSDPETQSLFGQVTSQLLANHADEESLWAAAQALASLRWIDTAPFLQKLVEKSPHREVQGIALLSQARSLDNSTLSEADRSTLVGLLERVVNEYGDVTQVERGRRHTLLRLAEPRYFELKNLNVGQAVPDLISTDLMDNRISLKQYRGKVIVLHFFADWCPYCRQLYPEYQGAAREYYRRPLQVIGISADEPAVARKISEEGRFDWPLIADGPGGPIATRWNVRTFPTIYVVDHGGVIRYKIRGKPGPDMHQKLVTAVSQLVKRAESESGGSRGR